MRGWLAVLVAGTAMGLLGAFHVGPGVSGRVVGVAVLAVVVVATAVGVALAVAGRRR